MIPATRSSALEPERAEESDEIYLLSTASNASVKIRDSRLDVKLLQSVDDDGLEQWKPALKSAFPVGRDDVAVLLEALGIDGPPVSRSEYTFEQLIEELVAPTAGLAAVDVHKQRDHYTVGGCMAEASEIRTAQGALRTLAVESEDAAGVIAAVRKLGLGARPNVNMARGLKTLVGLGAKRFAVIDVGTNSVKFHIGERHADGGWATIVDRAEVTRLGEGLDDTGTLAEAAVERTVAAIAAMAGEARRNGVEAIAAVGTAGLRIAPNRAVLVDAARERAGVEVEVISGEEEARLAYLGVQSGLVLGSESLVVFDTGGGSSQFTFGRGEEIDERFSLNVGAARFTERYGLEGAVSDGDAERGAPTPLPQTLDASTGIRRRTCSSEWVAPSRTSRRSSTLWPSTTPRSCKGPFSTLPRSTGKSSSTAHARLISGERSSAFNPNGPR